MYQQRQQQPYDLDYRSHQQQRFQYGPLLYPSHRHDTRTVDEGLSASSSQWDPLNRTRSVDAVIERAQILAGNINELAKNARTSVERVGEAATRTGALFDDNVGQIGANFQNLSTSANSRLGFAGASSPLLYALLGLLAVVGALGALLLVAITVQSWRAARRQNTVAKHIARTGQRPVLMNR